MEFLKQWTLCVCASVICAVIMSLFTPRGGMKTFYRILISFFVFFSFLYPLKNGFAISFDFPDGISFAQEKMYTENPYETTVSEQVKAVLKENNIDGASVMPEISTDFESGEITVKALKIAVPDGYDKEKVRNIVFDSLGLYAEVTGIGD